MAKYNKPSGDKKSIGVIITTLIFAIIGAVCILIGYGNSFLGWLKSFGIVICLLVAPILIYIVYKFVSNRIKDM